LIQQEIRTIEVRCLLFKRIFWIKSFQFFNRVN
jgi:hypothetical protein